MQFNKIAVAKFLASAVVGIGTGKIVGKIIKNNIQPETLLDKVTVTAAAWVIAAIATERTKKYTDDTIDSVVKSTNDAIYKIKTTQKLGRISRGESTFEDEGLKESDFTKNDKGGWVIAEVKKDRSTEWFPKPTSLDSDPGSDN